MAEQKRRRTQQVSAAQFCAHEQDLDASVKAATPTAPAKGPLRTLCCINRGRRPAAMDNWRRSRYCTQPACEYGTAFASGEKALSRQAALTA